MQTQNHVPSIRTLIHESGTSFTVATYASRSPIFRQGDTCDAVLHVESGRVELAVAAPSGRDAICGLLNEGAFLGEEVLAGRVARPCSATALTPTEVLAVTKTDMLRLLGTQQAFAERFIAHSVGRTARLEADLTDQLLYPCEKRLARVLLTLAEYDEQSPRRCPLPDVSQEFIARMVGTTRSRVNQFIGKFKKLGYVEDEGGVLQIHPAPLIRYCTRLAN